MFVKIRNNSIRARLSPKQARLPELENILEK
jgi:hypothetical protein